MARKETSMSDLTTSVSDLTQDVSAALHPSTLQLGGGRVVNVRPVSIAIDVADDHTLVISPAPGETTAVFFSVGDAIKLAEVAMGIWDRVKGGGGGGGGGRGKCTTTTTTTSKPDGSVTTTTTTTCTPAPA
jgi:hypothetical protein